MTDFNTNAIMLRETEFIRDAKQIKMLHDLLEVIYNHSSLVNKELQQKRDEGNKYSAELEFLRGNALQASSIAREIGALANKLKSKSKIGNNVYKMNLTDKHISLDREFIDESYKYAEDIGTLFENSRSLLKGRNNLKGSPVPSPPGSPLASVNGSANNSFKGGNKKSRRVHIKSRYRTRKNRRN